MRATRIPKPPRPSGPRTRPKYAPPLPHEREQPTTPIAQDGWIWCPLKGEWRILTPEEQVRQEYVLVLWHHYGYKFEQMDQERRVRHGHSSPKADIVVWASIVAKNESRSPILVVECKSDDVTIVADDYEQGDSYARATEAEFLVTHNSKETRYFRVIRGAPGSREALEGIPAAADLPNSKRMEEIRRATKAFSREEFRRLLHDCHSILRDNHKMDPGRAFDEISKILFIKMYVERIGRHENFTTDFLDSSARIRRRQPADVMHDLFDDTKDHYRADDLFGTDDRLTISLATFRRIVDRLQRFNLAATTEDVKGIAFERFLGQTFRGELGQFFTPRPIVDFMIELLNPREGEIVCDPASGSGGFLIKAFEYIRGQVEAAVQNQKREKRAQIKALGLTEEKEAEAVNRALISLSRDLDVAIEESRLYTVAHDCIFGADAEPRAARTSKMNMIMHGDGHGGIHHHDGLIDVNGIFPGRFDVILTNPPFGATVGDDQLVGSTSETSITTDAGIAAVYRRRFGEPYSASRSRMLRAQEHKSKILALFTLGEDQKKVKTEILFLERCIDLLNDSGRSRLGIVVPDGVLNNPSLASLRQFIEDRAQILAVISIPDKTFRSSKTAVKASLLFLRKLSPSEADALQARRQAIRDDLTMAAAAAEELLELAADATYKSYSGTSQGRPGRGRSGEAGQAALDLWGTGLDESSLKTAKSGARVELRKAAERREQDTRQRVRKEFDYDIFMGVAEHVGIRASGKLDPENDLAEILATYRQFVNDPDRFSTDVAKSMFRIRWSELDRWDPSSFRPIEWECDDRTLRPIGDLVERVIEPVDREQWDFSDLTPITIHFDGSVSRRDLTDVDDYSMDLFFARAGNIVVSKIDLKNGAVGIVPDDFADVVVTNHFAVYRAREGQLYPPYFKRLIQTRFFKDYLWRKKVGSEGRKEVKLDLFESTKIPAPSVDEQMKMVAGWLDLEHRMHEIHNEMMMMKGSLDEELRRGGR